MSVGDIISRVLSILYICYVIILTAKILLDNKSPEGAIAWIVTIVLLPYIGIAIYFLGGTNWKKKKIMKQLPEELFKTNLKTVIRQQQGVMRDIELHIDNDMAKAINLLLNASHSIITVNNEVKLYHTGKEHFEDLMRDLQGASHSIHMEYFIWRSDPLGERIKDILIAKAREGVEVRIIFDGVGCFGRISRRYRRELRENGIEYRYFLDPLNVLWGRMLNYRNHRKIVVIDGITAYTGGMNIGCEYITGGRNFPSWRDTHVRLRHEGVQILQAIFLTDWYNSGGKMMFEPVYFPALPKDSRFLPLQIAVSGPDSEWNTIKTLFFTLIANADREICIQSPYFIPDESILAALESAALGGIDVKLMMTGLPDKRIAFWVANTYFESLLNAGVKIYQYTKGFFHPKVLVVDGTTATVGTCNMDIRSFHLDYEVNIVFYDSGIARELRDRFILDMNDCVRITSESDSGKALPVRLRNSIFRIIAPLL
jgi:cardiolipin synthase